MRQRYWTRLSRVFLTFAVIFGVSVIPRIASATCSGNQQSCSTTYGVSQTQFGSGGVEQCPLLIGSQYCANASVGDLTDGNSVGTNYQTQAGPGLVINRAPWIAFSVGGVATNLGYLSQSSTATATANFTVQTYLAQGYIVKVSANPPTDNAPGNHKMSVPGTPTASATGTEQFGINLVANTSPSLGAAPLCSPSASFCPSGALATSITSNYNQTNKFYYPGSGANYTDTLVSSTTSTGSVSYTVSMIYNISGNTPSGQYTYNGMFVATSTY